MEPAPMKRLAAEQVTEFRHATHCHICGGLMCLDADGADDEETAKYIRVKGHDRITGEYLGAAHQGCNLNRNYKKYKIPVYFNNAEGYDTHLIIN